ncbi:putative SP-containing membrane protein [Vairimorpha necatrix]|uniref:SP-containing membrane protein n=1 Tax=Vairimorpha necatrix TaxID=6039 RepID=A0AAX4JCL2_9MICR
MISIPFNFILFTFISIVLTTNVNQTTLLNDIMKINKPPNCNILDAHVHETNLLSNDIQYIGKIIWHALVDNKLFKLILEKNELSIIFNNRSEILTNKYLNGLLYSFNVIEMPSNIPEVIVYENFFIEQMSTVTLDIFRSLNLCHKETIKNSKSITDTIKEIVDKNLCLKIYNEDTLPIIYFRKCEDLSKYYVECHKIFNQDMKEWFQEDQQFLSPDRCIESNFDSISTTTIIYPEAAKNIIITNNSVLVSTNIDELNTVNNTKSEIMDATTTATFDNSDIINTTIDDGLNISRVTLIDNFTTMNKTSIDTIDLPLINTLDNVTTMNNTDSNIMNVSKDTAIINKIMDITYNEIIKATAAITTFEPDFINTTHNDVLSTTTVTSLDSSDILNPNDLDINNAIASTTIDSSKIMDIINPETINVDNNINNTDSSDILNTNDVALFSGDILDNPLTISNYSDVTDTTTKNTEIMTSTINNSDMLTTTIDTNFEVYNNTIHNVTSDILTNATDDSDNLNITISNNIDFLDNIYPYKIIQEISSNSDLIYYIGGMMFFLILVIIVFVYFIYRRVRHYDGKRYKLIEKKRTEDGFLYL